MLTIAVAQDVLNTALYATGTAMTIRRPSLDLARLQSALDTRALSPPDVVLDVLDRIAACNADRSTWIHVIAPDKLLARAKDLQRRRKDGERLPLYGIPFAVKDNIDVAGEPTTAACPAYRYIARNSAHAVQRLEDAGAICIGKTNLDQFATGLVGTRSPFGACANPFDASYISGGSSAGSAVAVAMGHVSFALGTDTAGSGRVPAGFCNIVGLKPTRGTISNRGMVPACRSLDCMSIFALTVEDAWTVYGAARGYDPEDSYSITASLRPAHTGPGIRCGVPRPAQLEFFGDLAAEAAYTRALEVMRAIGCDMVEFDYSPFAEAARLLYEGPWIAERLAALGTFYDTSHDAMHPVVRDIIGQARPLTATSAFEAQYRLQALERKSEAQWNAMDMMDLPTAGSIYRIAQVDADPVQLNSNLGYYTNFVNLLDLSALAVPAPFRADGLPFGITLVGRGREDATLAALGAKYHRAACVTLGATGHGLPAARAMATDIANHTVTLAVVGAHLSGMPLNPQLTSRGARLMETCRTAASYRLYALRGTVPPKPGLVRDSSGAAIEVELWSVPIDAFGSFVADVPAPLAIGTVTLFDGREVKGFLCEEYALEGARDITDYGGWRRYRSVGAAA